MELHDYLAVLRKRWVSILLVALLVVASAITVTLLATPTYQARSQVFVSVRTGGTTADLVQGSNFTQRQVKSYTDLVTSPRVLMPVIDELGLTDSPEGLGRSIAASSPLDTVLINISVTREDPEEARDVANAVAISLATQVTELEQPADGQPSPVQINTVREATVPLDPASPNPQRNVALGLVLGLALGFGIALLREILDTKVRSDDDVKHVTDTSVIATVGYDEDAPKHPLIVQTNPHSLRAEAFRRLRTNLQFLDIADRPHSIVVTSALPGEGKSTTSINLAITLADSGSRVILVDADLRRPSVAEYMSIEGEVGLTTVLIGRASVQDVVQPWGNGLLHVLPSGQIPPNPSELLGSRSMANLLADLTRQYDIVLLDTPPLLPVTDAAILAKLAGGALVVVGSGKLHRAQLGDAIGSLETVGARVLGIVLNGLSRKHGENYTYYDYSPTSTSTGMTKKANRKRAGRRRSASSAAIPDTTPQRHGRTPPRRTTTRVAARDSQVSSFDDLLGSPEGTGATTWPGRPIIGGHDSQQP
ncbi:polysaccharide biosynthesis tyrosine autokinase [Actinotalea sp. K2]|uniref:polysaccharide biosynthesis tyrosine autokinase n=1 Tax=Actinotalea sp. K2 TaxID=2939438 RepID=UPI002016BBD7|nr:polysaccharide biosynthesis tyrosine autokinase [Actinotalea sp. K2]MCL3862911.1 polysaccharide biosynthesis tyrosine autokinase [Actinotalea sp. K2]